MKTTSKISYRVITVTRWVPKAKRPPKQDLGLMAPLFALAIGIGSALILRGL